MGFFSLNHYSIMKNTMTKKINEIFNICSINDIEFTMTKEGDKNYIDFNMENKKFMLNIIDYKDNELDSLLSKTLEDLKKTIQ